MLSLAVIMMLQGLMTSSYASDTYEVTEYFRFIDSNERMNSDGTFEYRFYAAQYSDYFYPTDDQIWIWTRTMIYDQAVDEYFGTSDVNYQYKVTLYKSIIGKTLVKNLGSYTGLCNGMNYQRQYDVEVGERYFFYIERVTEVNVGTGQYYDGYGKVSPVELSN